MTYENAMAISEENTENLEVFRTQQAERATEQLIGRSIGHGCAIASVFLLQWINSMYYIDERATYRESAAWQRKKKRMKRRLSRSGSTRN